jgi:hypothetical protein
MHSSSIFKILITKFQHTGTFTIEMYMYGVENKVCVWFVVCWGTWTIELIRHSLNVKAVSNEFYGSGLNMHTAPTAIVFVSKIIEVVGILRRFKKREMSTTQCALWQNIGNLQSNTRIVITRVMKKCHKRSCQHYLIWRTVTVSLKQ